MGEEIPQSSPLNPTAPAFTMPSAASETSNPSATNGPVLQSTPSKPEKPGKEPTGSNTGKPEDEAVASAKLTGAQLKKLKAAEKAARRAEKVAQKGEQQTGSDQKQQQQQQQQQQGDKAAGKDKQSSQAKKDESHSHHKRTGSRSQTLPLRRQSVVAEKGALTTEKEDVVKHVAMVSHLYPRGPRASLASAGREIHPAVVALGLQLRDYVICGGNARCVAMLLVFKKVIQSYTTPAGVALSRHLTSHLGHQISYINTARTLGVAQGNAIRWLKKLISTLDPDLAEGDAKKILCQSIDAFIREKVVLADEVISKDAGSRIDEGDVILTYGKSSVVEKTLKEAWQDGRKFKTIVVDSRPLFEGKNLAGNLIREGMEVEYALLGSLGEVAKDATKCILGASAMLGNGRLQSRSGTAMVAMMSKEVARCPVMVLCESLKFTAKVALDSVVMNELGDADALVEEDEVAARVLTATSASTNAAPAAAEKQKQQQQQATKGGKKGKDDDEQDKKKVTRRGLHGWEELQNLNLLNLMYDLTPSEYIDMVVCELGSLPPTAVPVVNGVHGGDE